MFALGATVLGMYLFMDKGQRQSKESSIFDDIASLRHEQNAVIKNVARNTADIDQLKAIISLKEPLVPKAEKAKAEPLQKLRAIKPQPANEDSPDTLGLSDTVVKELVQHAVGSERIDVFLQPVMRLPQRKMRFFEMYARIRARAGEYIPASRYRSVTDPELLGDIDNLLLMRCLRIVKSTEHLKRAAPFFLNIEANTLKNTRFMEGLLAFVAKNRDLAKRLIFEMKQEDFENLSMQVLQILTGLSKLGVSYSLDHVSHIDIDPALMMRYRVRYLKIEARWLIEQAKKGEAHVTEINRFKRKLEANGIGIIIEKIENESMMKELMDFDIHYGQGYLLGKPELEGAYRQGKVA